MISHILIPLDGSDASEKSVGPAQELADRFGARLRVLTAMLRFPESRIVLPKLDQRSVDRGREYLADVVRRHNLPDTTAEVAVLGIPAEAIVEFVQARGVDLICMSSHGTTGTDVLKHTMGSVAWKVLQHAPCPVYLVPIHSPVSG